MKNKIYFWTDYPFKKLGDQEYKKAPVRRCQLLEWERGIYCSLIVRKKIIKNIKCGYIYLKKGRYGDVPALRQDDLITLANIGLLKNKVLIEHDTI